MSTDNPGPLSCEQRLWLVETTILGRALPAMQTYIDAIREVADGGEFRTSDTTAAPVMDIAEEWARGCKALNRYASQVVARLQAGDQAAANEADSLPDFARWIVRDIGVIITRLKPLVRLLEGDRKLRSRLGPLGEKMETEGPVYWLELIEGSIGELRQELEQT